MKSTKRTVRRIRGMAVFGLVCLSLGLLSACTGSPDGTPPSVSVKLTLVDAEQGWVQVWVEGVEATGYRLLWGDTPAPYGITSVLPGQTIYEHFYQAVEGSSSGEQIPTTYTIQLVDPQSWVIATVDVLVVNSNCYLSLVSLEGRTVTVKYWGRFGIEYMISWGDRFADHVRVDTTTATGQATHTYTAGGTYSLGMEEIVAPSQIFFEITVP